MAKITLNKDYTLEINGTCIEFLKREDLEKLRDEIDRLIGAKNVQITPINIPPYNPQPIEPSQWPQVWYTSSINSLKNDSDKAPTEISGT